MPDVVVINLSTNDFYTSSFSADAFAAAYVTFLDHVRSLHLPYTDPSPTNPVVDYLSMFGIAFAGNTFLLLAAATLTRHEPTLRRLWSVRLLIYGLALLLPAWLQLAGRLH